MNTNQIKVFISYSHDSAEHKSRVLALSNRLRGDGIDAWIDRYVTSPPEGWQLWMEKQIRDSTFVLIVCTSTYLRRLMKEDDSGGRGVMWESTIIYAYLYEFGVLNTKFIPIALTDEDIQYIPGPLKAVTHYNLASDGGYQFLYRHLTEQPSTEAPSLGVVRTYPSQKASDSVDSLRPNLIHSHLLQANFTGRKNERLELTNWLSAQYQPICQLSAIGGMGKTALCWYWLTRDILSIALDKVYGVMWWSFYEAESSFDKFINEAFSYLVHRPVESAELLTTHDRVQQLRGLLESKRVLFVLDGFERQLGAYAMLDAVNRRDEEPDHSARARACFDVTLSRLLKDLIAGPTAAKVLLTTRLPVSDLEDSMGQTLDGVLNCELTGLESEDAVAFMRAQGVKTGTAAEIAAVCSDYGNHPLSLRLLSGFIARDKRNPGDIAVAPRYNVHNSLNGARDHILKKVYEALPKRERALISRIAAFRSSVNYDAVSVFNTLGSQKRFDSVLEGLQLSGLLQRDLARNRYDLHPVVRHYCYQRLKDKLGAHAALRDYFAQMPIPSEYEVHGIQDIETAIELYYHMVCSGRYDEAALFYESRLQRIISFRFGAGHLQIQLLSMLDGEVANRPVDLDPVIKGWLLGSLAAAHSLTGNTRHALHLYNQQLTLRTAQDDIENVVTALENIAELQVMLGKLRQAEENLKRAIDLTKSGFSKAVELRELGSLKLCCGYLDESLAYFNMAEPMFEKQGRTQGVVSIWCCRTQHALLKGDLDAAMSAASKAQHFTRELGEKIYPVERTSIIADWLFGVVSMQAHLSQPNAVRHLIATLTRCRRINLMEIESEVLLSIARWHHLSIHPTAAQSYALEALEIAERGEYRLKQADIHNLLAHLSLDKLDIQAARRHAESAKQLAWCQGPGYHYKSALDEAERMLLRIEAAEV